MRRIAVLFALVGGCTHGEPLPAAQGESTVPAPAQDAASAPREVVRLDQELHPNDDYEIVVDAWIDAAGPRLADVKMGWIDTGKADARSPFGRGVRRHVEITHTAIDDRTWRIEMRTKDTTLTIEVRLGSDGTPAAFADTLVEGAAIGDCRIDAGRLVARRVLGIPVGIDRIEVVCSDAAGERHMGVIRDRD